MTPGMKIATAVAIFVAGLTPAATLVAVWPHLRLADASAFLPIVGEVHMQLMLLALLLSLIPPAGVARAVHQWMFATRELSRLTERSVPVDTGTVSYRRIAAPGPVFFTAGVRPGAIYVSRVAEEQLGEGALTAGLLHESGHRESRDVLWRLLLQITLGAFGWLPKVAPILGQAKLRMECRADDFALESGATRRDLFEAISAVAVKPDATAPALASEGVQLRLERLALLQPEVPHPSSQMLVGLVALALTLPGLAHVLFLTFCDAQML